MDTLKEVMMYCRMDDEFSQTRAWQSFEQSHYPCGNTLLLLFFSQLPNTGYNATLNLTGHIILGLSVAASLLLYMFFSAFDRDYHDYHSRYGAYIVEKVRYEKTSLTTLIRDTKTLTRLI